MLSCQNVAHNVKSDLATQLLSVWSVSTHAHNFLNYVKIFFKGVYSKKRSIKALYRFFIHIALISRTTESRALYRLYSLTHTYASAHSFFLTHTHTRIDESHNQPTVERLVHSAWFPWQPGYWISPCVQAQWDGETKESMFRWGCVCSCVFVRVCVWGGGCSLRVCAVSSSTKTHSVFRCVNTCRDCLPLRLLLCEVGIIVFAPVVFGDDVSKQNTFYLFMFTFLDQSCHDLKPKHPHQGLLTPPPWTVLPAGKRLCSTRCRTAGLCTCVFPEVIGSAEI